MNYDSAQLYSTYIPFSIRRPWKLGKDIQFSPQCPLKRPGSEQGPGALMVHRHM